MIATIAVVAGPDSNTLTKSEDSKVTITEFLDYQCPACAACYGNVTKKLETDYAGRITFVTRDFPLSMHPLAQQSARAAEAAAIGLDLDRFHTDMDSPAVQERIDTDTAAGEKLRVNSTPTIYVNGTRSEPQGDSFADVDRELRDLIDKALGE